MCRGVLPNLRGRRWHIQPKPSMAERWLITDLDGGYWQCNQEHGRRLRVRTTKLQNEEDLEDTWDNITHLEQKEGDCPK